MKPMDPMGKMLLDKLPRCHVCGELIVKDPATGGTGYGNDKDGNKVCYPCCAVRDKKDMDERGKITLYLTHDINDDYTVSNWPGSLRYAARVRRGGHNWHGVTRLDVWFKDHHGDEWYGVHLGDSHQLVNCRRLKKGKIS